MKRSLKKLSFCLSLAAAFTLSALSQPGSAQLIDGDLAEEQAQEKQEVRDMRAELRSITGNVDDALSELDKLGQKVAQQQQAKEFHLFAREADWETRSGSTVKCLTYNGQIPGPPIIVQEGDFIKIVLHNQMKTPTSLQFHGMIVPHSVGGIPKAGAGLVLPGQTFVYQFPVKQPGTFWYHPQLVHPTQKQLGMFGAIIVQPKLRSRPYDKDITLFLSELRKQNAAGVATAIPWSEGPTPPSVETDYLMNGKSAPSIPAIELRRGERVRLRVINAGQESVPLQLGGHKMEIVAMNGGDRLEPHVFRDTIDLNPSDRVDVEFTADNPGVWALASESARQSTYKGKFPGGMACVVRYSELKAQPRPSADF